MMPNKPDLGNDRFSDEDMPETEHPTAAPQDDPELAADVTQNESSSNTWPDDTESAEQAPEEASAEEPAPDEQAEEQAEEPVAPAQAEAPSVEEAKTPEPAGEAEEPSAPAQAETPAEDVVAEAEPAPTEAQAEVGPEGDFAADEAPDLPGPKRGAIVEGRVIETSPTEVLIDLGEDLVGVVASRELERMDRVALEALKPGSPVTAYVLKARGSDGRPVLSLARAEEERNWQMAEDYHASQDVYYSKVAGYNKGGLIVRFGKVRGFVPASQVSRDRQHRAEGENPEARWGEMVGEDIAVKVVELDRARNRLILSERAAAREWREQQKSRLLEELAVGDVRKGRVISLADFGAFVDLGGADGLIHLTELSWEHVTHPREVLEVGQEVEVEVITLDRDRKRIGLSLKRKAHDPWQDVLQHYDVGQLVQATVTKLTKFGAFARLVDSPEIEGLIHISELADYRVSHPREVVLVGDVLTLRIVKIDPEQRRLGLSLRQVDSAKFMDHDWEALVEEFEQEQQSEDDGASVDPDEVSEADEVSPPEPDEAGLQEPDEDDR